MPRKESWLFPERLLVALHRRGMKQRDLADKIGVHQKVISKYVNSKTTPPSDTLQKIADALDVSVDWLLGRVDNTTEFHAEGVEQEYKPFIKILYRALKDGSEPSKRALMMLAESIVKEHEEEEKKLFGQRQKEKEE